MHDTYAGFSITCDHKCFLKSVHILYYLEMIIDFIYYNTAVEGKLMENTSVKQTNKILK